MSTHDASQPDMSFSRPNVVEGDDGRWRYRASTLGSCERALALEAMGQTPAPMPEHVQKGMDEGTANEQRILAHEKIAEAGWFVADRATVELYGTVSMATTGGPQLYTELDCGKAGVVTCHPDAILIARDGLNTRWRAGEHRVAEVKFMRGGWAKTMDEWFDKNPKYAWQFAVQMAATGLAGVYIIGEKDPDGKLVDVKVWDVDVPPRTRAEIVKRVAQLTRLVDRAVDGGTVPACDWPMYPCGFFDSHDGQPVWEKKEKETLDVDATLGNEIRIHAIAWHAAKEKEKQYKQKADAMRAEMLELLKKAGDESGCVRWGGWEVEGFVEEIPASTREIKAYTRRYVKVKRLSEETE